MQRRDSARAAGALALAGAAVLLARSGGARWAPSLLAGAGAGVFVVWRTVPGVIVGFVLLGAASAATWPRGGADALGALAGALPWALALEAFGLLTVLAVMQARDPRRISRRLLGSFLASTGIGLFGISLCAGTAGALGSALIATALAYRLGAVPVFAWMPMLLRHPARRIELLGVLGAAFAGLVLALILPLLPSLRAAAEALTALAIVTIPWAAGNAWRQRTSDPRCARTYLVVVGEALVLLGVGAGILGGRS